MDEDEPAVTWWIRSFDTVSEELADQWRIPLSWTYAQLRRLVSFPDEYPMYDSVPITPALVLTIDPDAGRYLVANRVFYLESDAL